uniref:Protein arginine N-methyltransferase domain-containing protein n=2 Tax=Amphimedon queenslandica TaxID=400682 RepID=A0A1X7T4Q6_AMPQE
AFPKGLVRYFDIGFEVPSYRVYFSTSPQDTPTHWHQTIFFLNEPIQVQTGGSGLRPGADLGLDSWVGLDDLDVVIYCVVVSVAIRTRIAQDHLISRYR